MSTYSDELEKGLEGLPSFHLLCFATLCCERHLDVYEAYSLLEGWGDFPSLKEGVEFVWDCLRRNKFILPPATLLTKCEASIPEFDEDPTETVLASAAQDVAVAVVHLLENVESCSVSTSALSGDLALDTVYDYVRPINDTPAITDSFAFDELMWDAPLMLKERRYHAELAQRLHSSPTLTNEIISELRGKYDKGGITPFDRGLVPPSLALSRG